MPSVNGHRPNTSISQNQRALLASAYNELGKELSSSKLRVVGNYTLGKVIGEGSYGKVRMGTHRLTGTRVAIKHIPKDMSAQLTREIHHHRQLHHPHITQMYEVIATESSIWIVAELCHGGELFDYLVENGRLSETETKVIFGQLCLAVSYLHNKGVVHRDLKLENVLLDEHCRVKLGDFGFTREWERGNWMETYCGTTGYAAPEMLQCKRYQGPEVDIWSLGVILFCLLTGALPFDDDDENVMKSMVIEGKFDDPEWLSPEARDLLKAILVVDPMRRPSLAQIISHKWFTTPEPLLMSPDADAEEEGGDNFIELRSRQDTSEPSTPVTDTKIKRRSTSSSILPPPPHTVRTPARTKRRSMSSAVSSPSHSPYSSGNEDEVTQDAVPPSPRPLIPNPHNDSHDFAALLSKKPPLIFSTDKERELLNMLSLLGLDTGQIVHSVLTDACDSSGAIWWMLSRKFEAGTADVPLSPLPHATSFLKPKKYLNIGLQTDSPVQLAPLVPPKSSSDTPRLTFVPPTPTVASNRPITPPPTSGRSLNNTPLLTPSSSSLSTHTLSSPSTPSSGSKGRKGRSGSVSIMQRATTALEAAGLVRKKSSEGIKDVLAGTSNLQQHRDAASTPTGSHHFQHPPERKSSLGSTTESGSSAAGERADSPRSSGISNKLMKNPPLKSGNNPPSTPPPSGSFDTNVGSPWIFPSAPPDSAGSSSSVCTNGTAHDPHITPTPAHVVPNMTGTTSASMSSTSLDVHSTSGNGQGQQATRPVVNTGSAGKNKANLLAAFRLWFVDDRGKEDKKGKRKAGAGAPSASATGKAVSNAARSAVTATGTVKRRTSGGGGRNRFIVGGRRQGGNSGHHSQRPSMSSRRSSSVNSRRSSIASIQQQHTPITPTARRTVTPGSSRPSSVKSFQMAPGSTQLPSNGDVVHKKSPSTSSANDTQNRAQSPLQRYHTRAGSGSSHATRVVRSGGSKRPRSSGTGDGKRHGRSNSGTSSVTSSRRGSWYGGDKSDGESISVSLGGGGKNPFDIPRSGSPHRTRKTSAFVAQKRTAPFMPPLGGSVGRSSWKKSWGLEPPGWSTRSINTQQAHSASIFAASGTGIEVLAISPVGGSSNDPLNVRDVFTHKEKGAAMDDGDEDDWVDEDDYDFGAFVGGLGQMAMKPSSSNQSNFALGTSLGILGEQASTSDGTVLLSAVPRHGKRGGKQKAGAPNSASGGPPPVISLPGPSSGGGSGNSTAEPFEGASRRQLPAGRARPPIVMEEDEEEEE